jgi:hypothetical protein
VDSNHRHEDAGDKRHGRNLDVGGTVAGEEGRVHGGLLKFGAWMALARSDDDPDQLPP